MCNYVDGLGHNSVVQDGYHTGESDFVYNVEHMDIFMMHVYPFTSTTPYIGPDHHAAIQLMADRWGEINTTIKQKNQALGTNTSLITKIQTQESNKFSYRFPTKEEILCSVNIALCYGSRGIVYYLYPYSNYGGGDYELGLLDDSRQPTSQYNYVRDLNTSYLSQIGSKFLELTWQESFNSADVPQNFITNITGEQDGTIEVGIFENILYPDRDYFMLVNRVCSSDASGTSADPQEITVVTNNNSIYQIKDMLTNEIFVSSTGTFKNIQIEAGGGRLFELKPLFNQDEIWSNLVHVYSDITVPDGATFTSSATYSDTWYGVVLDNADNNSFIKNCTFKYGRVGILCLDGSDINIEGNTFLYCDDQAIWIHESNPYIHENLIEYGNRYGIYMSYSSPYIYNNKIQNNAHYGVFYNWSSGGYLRHNTIKNNKGGVRCLSSSSPNLIGKSSSEAFGANEIIDNGFGANWWGVCPTDYSNPNLGITNDSTNYAAGRNSIYDNTLWQVKKNLSSNAIWARWNYWEFSPPYNYGTVYHVGPTYGELSNDNKLDEQQSKYRA